MAQDNKQLLTNLLPEGKAWNREEGSNLVKVLDGNAVELDRVDARNAELLGEYDPRTTLELLPDWERNVGLPDPCANTVESTLAIRRSLVYEKLTLIGGQSRQFYIDQAAKLGMVIEIDEPFPFIAGSSTAGDNVYNEDWIHHWIVIADEFNEVVFTAGGSAAGEPLRVVINDLLNCMITRSKPAHTVAVFRFINP